VGVGVEGLGVVVAAGAAALLGAEPQAAAGEAGPDGAGVLAAGEQVGGGDDRVAGIQQPGGAPLELQPVDDVLDGPVVAAGVPRGVHVGVEAVLVDQVPGHV